MTREEYQSLREDAQRIYRLYTLSVRSKAHPKFVTKLNHRLHHIRRLVRNAKIDPTPPNLAG